VPFSEAIRIAVTSLRSNKLRSFLTVLGILIGVSSVIAVVAITEGLDRYISEKVLELGTRSFRLQQTPDIITSHEMWMQMMKRKKLDMNDLAAIRSACTLCSEVGGILETGGSAKHGRTVQKNVDILGITENVPRIGTIREQAALVAVVGADIVDAFFGTMEPIGKEIEVDGHPMRIVGVAEKKGSVFGNSQDNFVWMPITTFQKLYGSRRSVTIQCEAASMAQFERAQDQVRVAIRARRHLTYQKADDFAIETGESIMDLWSTATRGICLLVGGIVVMNIMLVSVTERIREIGVRKAMGARRRDILRQFLVESVILSGFGGLLGVIGAATFSYVLATILGNIMSTHFSAPVRPWAVAMALGVASAVGLVAGIYPASRAAALDPVVALRNE